MKRRENQASDRARKAPVRWLAVATVCLVVGYVILRPTLERKLGVDLPRLTSDSRDEVDSVPVGDRPSTVGSVRDQPEVLADREAEPVEKQSPAVDQDRGRPREKSATAERRLGQLTEVGRGVQESTAGLRYAPGGPEGHRLDHVLRHDDDLPDRPGPHGVFDGGREELLAVLDEAYLLVRERSPRARVTRDDRRTICNVDMQRRVGFVGGQLGRRQGNPAATHVRLVLEGADLITAYPFRP